MTASKVDVVVLGCLAESPRHGYELLEVMRARHMDRWADVGKASAKDFWGTPRGASADIGAVEGS